MKVKINEKLICIPPHISTTWDQVSFLHTELDENHDGLTLILHLHNGKVVKIPHLDSSLIDIAFASHIRYMENATATMNGPPKPSGNVLQSFFGLPSDQPSAIPIRFALGSMPANLEGLEMSLQHNPAQANTPPLPPEVIEKVTGVVRMITNGDLAAFPKPEPHCNCMHCQMARAIHGISPQETQKEEEGVTEEDLQFRSWDIQQTGDKLYVVTSPLDPREQYTVYLGSPVGCTCGQPHCEHLKAVLSS